MYWEKEIVYLSTLPVHIREVHSQCNVLLLLQATEDVAKYCSRIIVPSLCPYSWAFMLLAEPHLPSVSLPLPRTIPVHQVYFWHLNAPTWVNRF